MNFFFFFKKKFFSEKSEIEKSDLKISLKNFFKISEKSG